MRLPEYRLRVVTVKVPEQYVEWLDQLVAAGLYRSRAEAIRDAIRRLVREELWGCAARGQQAAPTRQGDLRMP